MEHKKHGLISHATNITNVTVNYIENRTVTIILFREWGGGGGGVLANIL